MDSRTHKTVALLIESSRSYGRSLLRGIARYSRTQGNWSLLHEEMTIDAGLPGWLSGSKVHGIIARVDDHIIGPLKGLGVPIVDVRCRRAYPGIPQVETDDQAVVRLVFEHLWERGFRSFAFCGYRGAHYSETRLAAFREMVHAESCPLAVYETDGQPGDSLTSIERAGVLDVEPLSKWLSNLSPPTGLFVCNDIRGQQVLNACRAMGISVPDDLGVIGVDDDDAICPLSDPPLSSVKPDAEEVGFRAAGTLAQLMKGESPPSETEYIPPIGVAQRLSTQVMAVEDREVARACRFIRENAILGIDVSDVAQVADLSRRQLERRFRIALGRTPHEELTAVKIGRVKQLLAETNLSLEQLAPLAGFYYKERLSAVFKRETGETPGQYRQRLKE
jgi:LacI family transcriptional regulator